MTETNLLHFVTMRTDPPKPGEDWFRIVENKKDESAKVYIYDEIGMWGTTAKDFAATLDSLDAKTIHLHVNSPGGSVFDGLAIHASLSNHSAKVIAHVDGLAASAASFIIQAADERIATRNCQIMIHDAKAFAGGNAAQMLKASQLLDKTSDNIADMYSQRGTESAEEFRTRMKLEEWYTGPEAKDLGLVDTVSDADDEDAKDAKNEIKKWDLKAVFKYEGREDAPIPAAVLNQLSITNRVEEAPPVTETTNKTQQTTPPAVQQPGAINMLGNVSAEQADSLYASLAPFRTENVYDLAKVNAHVSGLETFRTEAIESSRKSFVKALAEGPSPKIAATQIKDMEEFVLDLSASQYDKWKASMEAAPAPSLLQTHGNTQTEQQAPSNGGSDADAEKATRISVLQDIVQNHKDSGIPMNEIETKPSYKELQALLAEAPKA